MLLVPVEGVVFVKVSLAVIKELARCNVYGNLAKLIELASKLQTRWMQDTLRRENWKFEMRRDCDGLMRVEKIMVLNWG